MMSDPTETYIRMVLARLTGLDGTRMAPVSLGLLASGEEVSLLDYLVSRGLLSRVAARAIHLAYRQELDEADLRQLIATNALRAELEKLALLGTSNHFGSSHATAASPAASAPPKPTTVPASAPHTPAGYASPSPPHAIAPGRYTTPGYSAAAPISPGTPPAGRMGDGMPQIGTSLGKYLLIALLGRGSAGMVYRALHSVLNMTVAVKVLHASLVANRRAYDLLRSEARVLAQLNHPNLVRVLDFEDDPHTPFVVMECIEGSSLAELLQQAGPLQFSRALAITTQIAEALQAVWGLGMVHRDVKPANILLGKDGSVKLADLGLALAQDAAAVSAYGIQTDASGIVGTAAYLAPEQLTATPTIDPRADMYALGVSFYQMLTGRLPFRAASLAAMLAAQAQEQPQPPSQLVPGISPDADATILKMLAKHPDHRHADYGELLRELRSLVPHNRRSSDAPANHSAAGNLLPGLTRLATGKSPRKPGSSTIRSVSFLRRPTPRRPGSDS
ncbi:serine/threonine-protein kinase [Tuwongella immobilis]|uniref:Protein kinase domain-containing protein n=1 Tax=Tuwongella immobilis TaxID=692036 RepID=A0A6C2YKK3_9BACT|nr:serine/threonine-protein kinase [Tuwongella immobilis]VIP01442.1 serine threonine protein kinase : Serine/threonine protein kinase OS=Isosphaera pallida (strain ATCC 43644 / DSM 9630 / IS1B) GN=Isop_2224 PE=4 SV=1: Pkinase [Tuwongella immobilis]VTR98418.1 serine threonine protein kinase : Serine/threonine protein kinase OS=Isosphaera pallida (strain ATCC 43644 / DSM 9630 / IS1B) GN=Isop_2224 PE=4 SV=1: Pkinase [Tuwongella immobilis]